MKHQTARILFPIFLGALVIVPLSGCGTQNASASTQSTAQTAKATSQDTASITAQDVKSINIKTSQGKTQVNQDIDKGLKSLDDSLKALDNSMGKIQ